MQKIIETNANKLIYKISESNIYNVVILNIENQNTKAILEFTILPNGYIKLEESLLGVIVVFFDESIQQTTTTKVIEKIKEDIAEMKEAIKTRVTFKEINKYIEKFKVLE